MLVYNQHLKIASRRLRATPTQHTHTHTQTHTGETEEWGKRSKNEEIKIRACTKALNIYRTISNHM